jgi:hypothetical protein
MSGDDAYDSYKMDCARAKVDPTVCVLTVDLQQVIFTPALTNSSSFYLRKLSNFNLGIHNSNDDSASMYLWTETTARRGSNEITSCLWDYLTSRFQPLTANQDRELIVWFDRCVGQNNNFIVVNLLLMLVWNGYFTSVNQKLFITGHSYNQCDRDFGLIEKRQRKTTLLVPSDIEYIIREARDSNPFDIVWLPQHKFLDFKYMSTLVRRPATLKVTKSLWYQYTNTKRDHIASRANHSQVKL